MANMMKRGRLKMMEEGLASQIAEFGMNFTHKDLEEVARSGRLVLYSMATHRLFSHCLTIYKNHGCYGDTYFYGTQCT